jgi:hypothetical protein
VTVVSGSGAVFEGRRMPWSMQHSRHVRIFMAVAMMEAAWMAFLAWMAWGV